MDEHLLCSTASAPTPGATTGTSSTNPCSASERKDKEEEMETENEKGKEKESSCMDVEALQPKRRKTTSEVWNDFERTIHGDKSVTATCKHCGKIFNGASTLGTTHLNNHKKTCKRRTHKDVGQQLLALSKSMSVSVPKLASFKFDPERTRKDFVRMIAKHCYPIDMIDHEYFQIYVSSINPTVKFNSITVRNDIMDVFQEEKEKLYAFLDKLSSRVSLTTDLWRVEHQNFGYCVVTCHYIDDEWNLHKRILSYKMLPTPHSGEAISEHIKGQLLNWNLDKKICSITMDNASKNDFIINYLKLWLCRKEALLRNGEIFHVCCGAHILHLIVQDGLEELKDVLVKIRDMVRWINDSPSRIESFRDILVQTRLSHKKSVSLDVATEWNSTCEMLHNALDVREAFERLAELHQNFKTLPTDEEWEKCKSIGQCLKAFNDAIKHLSDSKYPTANFYFWDVCDLHHHLLQWRNSKDDCIRSMAFTMRLKFEKYWKEINLFMALGVILDPRYKMELIVFGLNAIYGDDADYHIKKIKFDVLDFYSEYACRYGGSCCSLLVGDAFDRVDGNGNDSLDEISKKKTSAFSEGFKKYMQQRSRDLKNAQKSELDLYLEESLFPIGDDEYCFDILHWWKQNDYKFPILARMARDILAVPASTVALESAFSLGSRLITEYHPLLTPEVVEALICLRDWLPSYKSATTLDE
ncbi:zinc finger BED domain-containing protein RICESLEEPER 2-like [Telopea speciosissima]|uniref:zinc finger BED domain-containing protein RICESLEEPER 2-like n=1 Tax=Telopea speciosissima TaxID=54955 RepID=UPI001CC37D63|nr:zinc finger BED domain-containing protein RICESLEEPER 2-like [Telopea speciosissima]